VGFYESWSGPVVSTEAVVTEATHLLNRIPGGITAVLDFFVRGGAVIVPTTRDTLERCSKLIETYSDLPMDYADATLVALAEDVGTELVLTTDRRDFSVYRLSTGAAFEIVP
jgi:predicted nucleic acid-binding protein